ncbi:hypothetical protein TNCV_4571951 [Trichonephila clavipes]|nr:hypothetical protein TNCV_4571951 [Trichonephila clavipes]
MRLMAQKRLLHQCTDRRMPGWDKLCIAEKTSRADVCFGINTRRDISSNIVRSWNVYNICGELRDEIQLMDLPLENGHFLLKATNVSVFLEKKANGCSSESQLGEVHLLRHNQRRPLKEQKRTAKVKDRQRAVQHQQGLFTPLKC